jgi:hypothetical protein
MSRKLIEGLVDPRKSVLWFLVLGTYGLTLASDALSDLVLNRLGSWLETQWGLNPIFFRLLIFAFITAIIVLAIALTNLSKWFSTPPATVKPKPLRATMKGLIVVASIARSGVKSAAQEAIEHHWSNGNGNLQHCWIICGGTELENQARILLDRFEGEKQWINDREFLLTDSDDRSRQLRVFLKTIIETDLDDPHATFALVNQIYTEADRLGIEDSDLIADYTGGTKSMTAGIILACTSPERRLQFLRPGGYTAEGRADTTKSSLATEVEIAFKLKPLKGSR